MKSLALCVLLFLLLVPLAVAQDEAPKKDAEPAWKETARGAGLDAKAVSQLERDGLLITNESYRQVFTPYIWGKLPPFITSDAVLNAFHVLLEDSVRRMEVASIDPLALMLQEMLASLPPARGLIRNDKDLYDRAEPLARRLLAVGLALLGRMPELSKPDTDLVQAEVKRIEEGTARLKPEWLGPPDPGFMAIDYGRFVPRGLYAEDERLQRFFRATKWLQVIPLRVENDNELAAAVLLDRAFRRTEHDYEHGALRARYAQLIGPFDDLVIGGRIYLDSDLKTARQELRDELPPAINDQDRDRPQAGESPAQASFRVLPGHRLADALLLQRMCELNSSSGLPSGLHVAAALGSPIARKQLKEVVLVEIDKYDEIDNSSIYGGYLKALGCLNTPEADAPELFKSDAWQIKSCNTQLAGWTQMRHTWELQAKDIAHWRLATRQHPGFVEPVPEFFCSLAHVCEQISTLMDQHDAFKLDTTHYVHMLREYARVGEAQNFGFTPEGDGKPLTSKERRALRFGEVLAAVLGIPFTGDEYANPEEAAALLKALRATADQLERGSFPHPERLQNCASALGENHEQLWTALGKLIRRCEAMAHKQLRGAEFNESERDFLEDFGKQLGHIMLYQGNSWLWPYDDAPRVANIAWDAENNLHLHAAVARPRALFVLYQWRGELVLCQGAVLPYYEITGDKRINDSEWMARLGGDDRPQIPAWLAPIVHEGRLGKPLFRKD